MRILRVLSGALVGALGLVALWASSVLDPPESVSRFLAVISAVYPAPIGSAVVERIPCPPLRRLRLYGVCTGGCEEIWRIVGVRGLEAVNLENLNRQPAESQEDVRRVTNALVRQEGLRLDEEGARQMIGCYMRLDALRPELVLSEEGAAAVERARAIGEEAMAKLAATLPASDEPAGVAVTVEPDGFTARFLYWSTAEAGRPVLETVWRLERDGRLRSVQASPRPAFTDDNGPGSTPGTSPS
jgi:hypothetical protein